MRTLYLDCFAGASGDMILGALLDLGIPAEAVLAECRALDLAGFELKIGRTMRRGIGAVKVDVLVGGRLADSEFAEVPANRRGHEQHDHEHHGHHHDHAPGPGHSHGDDHGHGRPLSEILALLERSRLTPEVREIARRTFLRLGKAESRVHGADVASVHFHEVGGTDAIIDIVGAAAAFHCLGAEQVVVSRIHLGGGFVETAHGRYPVPAPATAYLLEGALVYSTDIEGELTTPTGAAILTELADRFGAMPAMQVERVGYGAGTRDREIPNVLRAVVGDTAAKPAAETVIELAANIDDMNPQFYEHVMAMLFERGALDVWLVPAVMKKSRPAVVLHVLGRPADTAALTGVLLRETTTLGVRRREWERQILERAIRSVQTPWGEIRVKIGTGEGGARNVAPEYADCQAAAVRHGVPIKQIHAAALTAAWELSG